MIKVVSLLFQGVEQDIHRLGVLAIPYFDPNPVECQLDLFRRTLAIRNGFADLLDSSVRRDHGLSETKPMLTFICASDAIFKTPYT